MSHLATLSHNFDSWDQFARVMWNVTKLLNLFPKLSAACNLVHVAAVIRLRDASCDITLRENF